MTWAEWFRHNLGKYPTPWAYLFACQEYMRPVVEATKRWIDPPAHLIEMGCGIGMSAMAFASEGYFVQGLDWDEDVLTLASTLPWFSFSDVGRHLATRDHRVHLVRGDVLKEQSVSFHAAFSGGVIEHLGPAERVTYLSAMRMSPVQIVVIPSPLQLALSNEVTMDEQPIPLSDLIILCQMAGWTVAESFGFGGPGRLSKPGWEGDPYLSLCVIGCKRSLRSQP